LFGSNYILSPAGRLLWGLQESFKIADARNGTLEGLAWTLKKASHSDILALADSPLVNFFCAALANLSRHQAMVPEWIPETLLRGIAERIGVGIDVGANCTTSPSGFVYRFNSKFGMVAENSVTGDMGHIIIEGPVGLRLVGDFELMRILVGDELTSPIAKDPIVWKPQLEAGLAFLRRVSPEQEDRFLRHVSLIASFDAPPGLLQSLSVGELPGFILVRANNGPAEVCDQLVHETSHQMLDRYLAERPGLVEELRQAPSAYSPFFQQPRPAIKLLHGLVSYLEVLRFWQKVISQEAFGPEVGPDVARNRRDHVEALCETGCRSLHSCVDKTTWERWSVHLNSLCPAFAPIWERVGVQKREATTSELVSCIKELTWLAPIERAEVLLALDGLKISRVSVSLQHGADLARALDPHLSPLYSRRVFITRAEQLKGNFSNLPDGTFEYYRPPPGSVVFAYLGRDRESLVAAVDQDEINNAGDKLDIPPCCQLHFASHWAETVEGFEGDLLSWSFDSRAGGKGLPFDLGIHPPENNAFALVLGKGFTWHFPCSLDCRSTVDSIRRRKWALEKLDTELASSLWNRHRGAVIWTPDRAFLWAPILWVGRVPTVVLAEAESPEWTNTLRALAGQGEISRSGGIWRTSTGELIEEMLPNGSRIVLFDDPVIGPHVSGIGPEPNHEVANETNLG